MSVRFCALGERGGSIVGALPADGPHISASVGFGGANLRSDVVQIQSLLNQVPAGSGSPANPLKVDGIVGPLTIAAIRRFQTANLGFNDGRIDPGGGTLARLSALASQQGPSSTVVWRVVARICYCGCACRCPQADPAGSGHSGDPHGETVDCGGDFTPPWIAAGIDCVRRQNLPSLDIRYRKHTFSLRPRCTQSLRKLGQSDRRIQSHLNDAFRHNHVLPGGPGDRQVKIRGRPDGRLFSTRTQPSHHDPYSIPGLRAELPGGDAGA